MLLFACRLTLHTMISSKMPWLTFGEGAKQRETELTDYFEVDGLPTLVCIAYNVPRVRL